MKKYLKIIILIVVALFCIFFLVRCSAKNNNSDSLRLLQLQDAVRDLQTEVKELQNQLSNSQRIIAELQNEVENLRSNTSSITVQNPVVDNKTESSSNTSSQPAATAFLDNLIQSGTVESLLRVAEADYATESQLITVAKKTAELNYIFDSDALRIAEALSKNPNTSNKVMVELSNSGCSSIVDISQKYIEDNRKR